jgi:glucose-1-phosphate thymidylyltransferase
MNNFGYKGIILAGGSGTRLHPLTKVVSKQLLPVYDMPMIYYPLKTLVNAGIKDILIISNPENINNYKTLLENGKEFNVSITYKVQEKPKGIAQAFEIGKNWLNNCPVVLILGDNLFLGGNTSQQIKVSLKENVGATIFGYEVNDPSRYGVVDFDSDNNVLHIEEKPLEPRSNWAVTGLYIYDNEVVEHYKELKPSKRGELEITDLNNIYLKKSKLKIRLIENNSFWLDAGTKDSLLEASNIVKELKNKKISLF